MVEPSGDKIEEVTASAMDDGDEMRERLHSFSDCCWREPYSTFQAYTRDGISD